MNIKKIIVKIYIKGKKFSLATAELSSEDQLNDFLEALNGAEEFISFGELILNRSKITHVVVKYK